MGSDFLNHTHPDNLGWIDFLYKRFLDEDHIDTSWKYFFEGYSLGKADQEAFDSGNSSHLLKVQKAQFLLDLYRNYGYLGGCVFPLSEKFKSSFIDDHLKNMDFSETISSLGFFSESEITINQFITFLENIYCGSLVVETLNCSPDIQEYIWNLFEADSLHFTENDFVECYKNLSKANSFEEFLQVKFTGQKRFSLEGCEILIPMLKHLFNAGEAYGLENYILGMSHRGRLNVLTNVFHKPYREIFMEFEDTPEKRGLSVVGDVKYHKGYLLQYNGSSNQQIKLLLLPNSSHLESISPIVMGVSSALQTFHPKDTTSSLSILIHGDAAFSGQGVVYETLQLGRLSGYSTQGSLHIVVNNQIGFTAQPKESRSSSYCTDIAKMFGTPVFRVNAEDPEACLKAIVYALKVRQKFACDVFIDLCCYRKHGHNESDDPSVVAPILYKQIKDKRSISKRFKNIIHEKFGNDIASRLDKIDQDILSNLKDEYEVLKGNSAYPKVSCSTCEKIDIGAIHSSFNSSLDMKLIENIISKLITFPKHFNPHIKIKQLVEKRKKMLDGSLGIDWGLAEQIAFSSLLIEGSSVRLSGQDSIRGTFSQRNLLWMDIDSGESYSPLHHLATHQGFLEVYNSPLSEYAVLGFEFGYSQYAKNALVMWEAQFGDFANGAQIIFDNYISSAIQKWDLHSNVVLLLPHGYEGQGPEHSSARIERYLQLASNYNFQVVQPSTPAQYFCILREHVKKNLGVPLIIFTPKALLRHPGCVSTKEDFTNSCGFNDFIEDDEPNYAAQYLILCSGKIYYDYLDFLSINNIKHRVSCVRIERLYPLCFETLINLFEKYQDIKDIVWLQEEHSNMGCYEYIYMALKNISPKGKSLRYIGRGRSASTATGSTSLSKKELESLFNNLFDLVKE